MFLSFSLSLFYCFYFFICLFFFPRFLHNYVGNNNDSAIGFDFPHFGEVEEKLAVDFCGRGRKYPHDSPLPSKFFNWQLASAAQTVLKAWKPRMPQGSVVKTLCHSLSLCCLGFSAVSAQLIYSSLSVSSIFTSVCHDQKGLMFQCIAVNDALMHMEKWDLRIHTNNLYHLLFVFLNNMAESIVLKVWGIHWHAWAQHLWFIQST